MPETERTQQDTSMPGLVVVAALALALISLGLYRWTLHPGVGPSLDSMELQIAAGEGGIIHPPGSPQYLMLGHLAMNILPGPNAAYRLNLMSALFAAAMVGVLFLLTYRLTQNLVASSYAALTMALAPRIWYQASITELYALNAFYVVLVMYLLVSWHETKRRGFFWAGVVVYALSFGNHVSMILLLPVFLYIVEITDRSMLLRPRNLALVALIVLLAAAQYLYIPIRAAANPTFCNYCPVQTGSLVDYVTGPLLDYLTGGPFKGQMFSLPRRDILARLPEATGLFARQFLVWGFVLGIVGIWELFQREAEQAWMLVLALASELIFVLTYDIPDWHDFMTPSYVLFAPLVGYGAWQLWEAFHPQAESLLIRGRTLAGHAYPIVMIGAAVLSVGLSYYAHYPLSDQSEDTAYGVNGRALLEHADPGDWVLMPHPNSGAFYYSWAVRYLSLAENDLPDVSMVSAPEVDPPPGPPPAYIRWPEAEPQLSDGAIRELDHRVFLLDAADERAADWVLLPVCSAERSVAGYEVVGTLTDGDPQPFVNADRWSEVQNYVLTADEPAVCPPG